MTNSKIEKIPYLILIAILISTSLPNTARADDRYAHEYLIDIWIPSMLTSASLRRYKQHMLSVIDCNNDYFVDGEELISYEKTFAEKNNIVYYRGDYYDAEGKEVPTPTMSKLRNKFAPSRTEVCNIPTY